MLTFNAKGNNVVQWSIVVEYQTRNRDLVVGSIHTRSTASNLEQVANLLCFRKENECSISSVNCYEVRGHSHNAYSYENP